MLSFEVIVPKPAKDLISRLSRYEQIAARHQTTAMRKSVTDIEGGARENAPVGVSSRLRNSLASEVKIEPAAIVGRVGSSLKSEVYPIVMEKGRRFGRKAPPPGALDRWVKLRLRVPEKMVKRVAFLVGRKIARRGIMGRFFLRKAYFAARVKIQGYFRRALRDTTKELAHGRY